MPINADTTADWLVSGLELRSTLFHMGQYCGEGWRTSTAGHQRASFHVVLHGECWLHLPERAGESARRVALREGDAVFLLHDIPHCLCASPVAPGPDAWRQHRGTMLPLATDAARRGSVGLACGFFEFRSGLDGALLALLPDHLIARHGDAPLDGARTVFTLLRAEARLARTTPAPLIARLTELLFLYALRDPGRRDDIAPGLWPLLRQDELAPLVAAIVDAPAARWTTDTMAAYVHMSRARFCKRFAQVGGRPPAQFVTLLRMKLAAALLRAGTSVQNVAEQVGYQSESAFAQAFKRVTGMQPGAYRRSPDERAASGADRFGDDACVMSGMSGMPHREHAADASLERSHPAPLH
ncbi:MAG: AraC family transcriptional regulator [Janthinobacterium lividum]